MHFFRFPPEFYQFNFVSGPFSTSFIYNYYRWWLRSSRAGTWSPPPSGSWGSVAATAPAFACCKHTRCKYLAPDCTQGVSYGITRHRYWVLNIKYHCHYDPCSKCVWSSHKSPWQYNPYFSPAQMSALKCASGLRLYWEWEERIWPMVCSSA